MTRGRVHWYTKGTGHGFIKPDDGGPMAFVRREDLAPGEEENLKLEQRLSFISLVGSIAPMVGLDLHRDIRLLIRGRQGCVINEEEEAQR